MKMRKNLIEHYKIAILSTYKCYLTEPVLCLLKCNEPFVLSIRIKDIQCTHWRNTPSVHNLAENILKATISIKARYQHNFYKPSATKTKSKQNTHLTLSV